VGPGDGSSPGPIVLHGGFTSAFAEFTDDKTGGTGRLMISIACWLVRMEERSLLLQREGVMIKTMPLLLGEYEAPEKFTGWNEKPITGVDYLFMIDATSSMKCLYYYFVII
jgi:hypothetical protein